MAASLIAGLIGIVSGLVGYYTYTRSGLVSALIATFAAAWLLYRFSSGERAWSTFGLFLNPATAALLFFLGGFIFFAVQGSPFPVSLVVGVALAFIGAVAGMVFHKYWQP